MDLGCQFATRKRGSFSNFSQPMVIALNGVTCAGGLELAMARDIILAAESAGLADAHVNFGVHSLLPSV